MTMGGCPAPPWIAPPYRNFWTRAQAGWPECRRRPEGLPRDADRVWPRTGRLRRGAGAAVGRLNATCADGAKRDPMADEIRNGGSKMRVVVRLLGHRDDAGAWEIHDFFERSVVGTCAIALSSASPPQRARGRWPSPLCTDTWKKPRDPVCPQP